MGLNLKKRLRGNGNGRAKLKGFTAKVGTLTARKAGGTMFGNMLRTAANTASHGILGNGAMMIQEGETIDQTNERSLGALSDAAQNAGFGMALGQKVNNGKAMNEDTIKAGAAGIVKKIVVFVLLPLTLIVIIYKFATRKNGKK